jgi:glucose-6-phosphate dehydrogenase assembly protein OpcA
MTNNTAGTPLINLPWAGKWVPIEEVDSVLSSLWKMSVDNMRTGPNLNVRTSVFNLVICTPDTESAHYASKILRDLSNTHLARAMIVILNNDEQAPDSMDSWVALRCFSMLSDLMRHCFEETTLLVSGQATKALSHTLPSLLKTQLPTYLWWIGDTTGTDDMIFRGVAELCQRVIVDSATFFQPEQDIHALSGYCKSAPLVALSDLNWGRLTLWRHLIAQFFDIAEHLPFLAGVEKIEIEHAAAPLAVQSASAGGGVSPNPTAALLLIGWLKARLSLELVSESAQNQRDTPSGTYQWLLKAPDSQKQVVVEVRPHVQADLPPGSLSLVRLTCQAQNQQALFTVKRDSDTDYVLTSVSLADSTRPGKAVNLPARLQTCDLVHNELEITGHDPFFEEALQELELLLTVD